MNSVFFDTVRPLAAAALALGVATTANATAYYWKGGSSWADYGTLSNWSTESADGADAAVLPGSADGVNQQSCYFDMGGGEYTLGSKTEGSGGGAGQFRVQNGTLHISSSASVQNAGGHVLDGGRLVIDGNATLTIGVWNGSTCGFSVDDGGVLQVDGKLDMWNGQVTVNSGGTFILNGKARFTGGGARAARIIIQGGNAIVTNGFSNTTSTSADTPLTLRQTSGSLTLGGDIYSTGNLSTVFEVSGGSIHVVSDCAVRAATATMSGSSLALEIDDGVSFDLSGVTITVGTITKTGAGDFTYMPGNMPNAIVVNAGGLALATANTSYDISSVTFAAGTKLKLGATGITLSSWDASFANATIEAVPGFAPANGSTVFTCADASIVEAAAAGLNATLPAGITVSVSGNSLVAETHYTFNSTTVTDMSDPDGWLEGAVGIAGQPIIISGSGVAPVMDEDTPAYASISVEDGASLTVAGERDIPATTLAAGTGLNIAKGNRIFEEVSYDGYVLKTDTLVGTMDPSRSITELTNIAGLIGGSAWAATLKGTPYSRVDVSELDNGAKLQVQFKQWESNNAGSYMKCVVVELRKDSSGNIYAKAVRAAYRQNNPDYDYDFMTGSDYNNANVATTDAEGNYGVKGLSFISPVSASASSYATQYYDGTLPLTATVVGVMDSSAGITTLTNFTGTMAGAWSGHGSVQKTLAKSVDGGASLLVQFKVIDGTSTKCAIARFTNVDGTIYAQAVAGRYLSGQQDIDHDFVNADGSYNGTQAPAAGADSGQGYGVKDFSFDAPRNMIAGATRVTATGNLTTTGSGSVTVDVANGCVLDLSGVDVATSATLVKTGSGMIVFGDELPSALQVNAGVLAVQPYVEYNTNGVALAASVSIMVAIDGTYKQAFAVAGQNGGTTYMTGETYIGVGGWDTIANWLGGVLPGASATAHIHGDATVLTLDAVPTTMPSSIVVGYGATLRTAADVTFTAMTLDGNSMLDVSSGTATMASSIACNALADGEDVTLPILSVQAGATLQVPGGTKFKNVDMRLFGKIKGTSDGKLYFGHAGAGETSYIAVCMTNNVVETLGGAYDYGASYFACPDAGGTVIVVRPMELKSPVFTRNQYNGINIGVNNPVSAPFEAIFDEFTFAYCARCRFGGGATVTFRNSALSRNANTSLSGQGGWDVTDGAKVIFDNTTHFYEYPDGNSVNWSPAETGAECFILTNSTVMWSRPNGNNNGKMTVYDSFYDCAYDAYAPANNATLPDLFKGLGVLDIPVGFFCGIRAKDHVTWGANDDAPERICKIDSGMRFAGGGDLVVSNAVSGRRFEVTMQSGDNSCTGTVSVASPEGFDAKLLFADGANWAGTVVAGNISLTNLTDGVAAAAVSFGALDLAAGESFPLRVWAHSGPQTNDVINVGRYVNGGGELAPLPMDGAEDEKLAGGTNIRVGTIGKASPLPIVPSRWRAVRAPIEGDDANDELILKVRVGLTIIVQ